MREEPPGVPDGSKLWPIPSLAKQRPDQTARKFSAEDLPVFGLRTTSKEAFCPSLRLRMPACSTALMCTKNILAAVIRLDESVALLAVEPLVSFRVRV